MPFFTSIPLVSWLISEKQTFKNIFKATLKYWYWVVIALLTLALVLTREKLTDTKTKLVSTEATLKKERADHDQMVKDAEKKLKETESYWRDQSSAARTDYLDRLQAQKPIVLQQLREIKEYEKTPAGQFICVDPGWVQRLKAQRAALFPESAGSSQGSNGAVSPQTASTAK